MYLCTCQKKKRCVKRHCYYCIVDVHKSFLNFLFEKIYSLLCIQLLVFKKECTGNIWTHNIHSHITLTHTYNTQHSLTHNTHTQHMCTTLTQHTHITHRHTHTKHEVMEAHNLTSDWNHQEHLNVNSMLFP